MVDLRQWLFEIPESLKPDGLIMSIHYAQRALARKLARQVPHTVSIGGGDYLAATVPRVEPDYVEVGIRAADHMLDAGFRKATVYWEGEDEDGEGNGEFTPEEKGEADLAWIAYIVAEK